MYKPNFDIIARELSKDGFERLSDQYLKSDTMTVYSTGARLICEGRGIVFLELDMEPMTNERILRLVDFLMELQHESI